MNYWTFTVTSHKSDGREFTAEEVLKQRTEDEFWGLGEKTPNRKNVEQGDRIVFYVGNPLKSFAASATLATGAFKLSKEEQDKLSHGTQYYRTPYGVRLQDIRVWSERKPVVNLLSDLDFIENKEFWGSYFQGGIRGIGEADFERIIGSIGPTLSRNPVENIESTAEFALETHLEEFLDRNWESIDFGLPLKKYDVEGQSGRQFPAGPWSIDFLCVDNKSGDFVVIELKKGQTSDATVGQIARYMSYVKKNLAKPEQCVQGVIVAKDVDDALRYAIEAVPNVRVMTYRVDFKLRLLN
jgi:predicted RNA-binding protein